MANKKKDLSDLERGVGLIGSLIKNLMDISRELGVPFEAIHRLATPAGQKTLERMMGIAHQDWFDEAQNESAKPLRRPFRLNSVRRMLPATPRSSCASQSFLFAMVP